MREITPEQTSWGTGRRSYRRGDDSWTVVALQIGLDTFGNSLELDGMFGPATERVVKAFQTHRALTADGVAGPRTQRAMCIELSQPAATEHQLPAGLLRGVLENESGYLLAAWTPHPSDDGFDLGAYQDAYFPTGSQDQYRLSLDVRNMAYRVAENYQARYTRYRASGTPVRLAWECAALSHNYPSAADRMAKGLAPTVDADSPAEWVIQASGGRLQTPREWCDSYVAAVTKYLDWSRL